MTTLLEKVSILISANMHALINQALQSNSLAVIDQYIRQAEDQLENLEDAAATVGGEAKSIRRRLNDLRSRANDLDQAIDALLVNGNEPAAVAAQSKLNSTHQLIETYQAQLERQDEEYHKLLDAKVRLEGRHAAMKQQREELSALLDLAKSKEIAHKAMQGLDDLLGSGDKDISRLAGGIQARLDRANAALEVRSASLDEQINAILERDILQAQLAERKKRLAQARSPGEVV